MHPCAILMLPTLSKATHLSTLPHPSQQTYDYLRRLVWDKAAFRPGGSPPPPPCSSH